jgi:tryptophan 2-monooxygenase
MTVFSSSIAYAENLSDAKVPVVLTGCSIWDGKSDNPPQKGEILIIGKKISEIGTTVSRPQGARIIDLTGHTVTPGFIDCHVHMAVTPENLVPAAIGTSSAAQALHASQGLRIVLMNGFTSVRDVGAFDHLYITIDLKRSIEAGETLGPRMFVAPHILSATGSHGDTSGIMAPEYAPLIKLKGVVDGPEEIRKAVREEIKAGADWIKFAASGGFASPTSDPGKVNFSQVEMDVLVETAHDLGVPVCAHAYGDESIKRAVQAGVDSIEHGSMASPKTMSLIEKKGIFIVPTQFATDESLNNINNPKYWVGHAPQEYLKNVKYSKELLDAEKNLAKSNVKVAFGTDTGLFPYKDELNEFSAMVKNGITPLRALKSATSMAAELLRRPDLGFLAPGQTADIIAMPGDPFKDIDVTGKVDFVMKDGVVYKQPF